MSGSADPWVSRVVRVLEDHLRNEASVLDDYVMAEWQVAEGDVAYLLRLLAEDEARHHRVLGDLLSAVRWGVDWRRGDEPALAVRTPVTPEVRSLARRLGRIERDDARELRELAAMLGPVAQSTVWPLLVELLRLDTKKHQLILKYLARR